MDGDLASLQSRHGAVDLAHRPGHVPLAAEACRSGRRTHRCGHLRRQRLRLGPSDPHQHDQCPGQRPVRDLGTGSVLGIGSMARGRARRSGLGIPGFRRPPSGRIADDRPGRSVRSLSRRHRARLAGAAERGRNGDGAGRSGCFALGRAVGPLQGAARSLASGRWLQEAGGAHLRIVESRAVADRGAPRSLWHPRAAPTGCTGFTPTTR